MTDREPVAPCPDAGGNSHDPAVRRALAAAYQKGLADGAAAERERIADTLRSLGVILADDGVRLNIAWGEST